MDAGMHEKWEKESPANRLRGHIKALLDIAAKSRLVHEIAGAPLEEFVAVAYLTTLPFKEAPDSYQRHYIFRKDGTVSLNNYCPPDRDKIIESDRFSTWGEGFYDLLLVLHEHLDLIKDPSLREHIANMIRKSAQF